MTQENNLHLRHEGEWVAICEGEIIACGDSPSTVIDSAREICKGKETSIFRVPEKNQILLL